jgi:hypothetical protein
MVLALLTSLISCQEDSITIGDAVIGGSPFKTGKKTYNVFAYNRKIDAVQTNRMPIYQIGTFQDPVYGRTEAQITTQLQLSITNPVFGRQSASNETTPENETVTEVILYLPYLQNVAPDRDLDGVIDELDADPDDPSSDTDGDGLSDSVERTLGTDPFNQDTDGDGINDADDDDTLPNRYPKKVDLDSIYGNREAPFNLKVERSTFFLRDLDPNSNFESSQEYFSNKEYAPDYVSDVLFDDQVTISNEEYLIFKEDDPDTEDDESLAAPDRIRPGIRVSLDPVFFQQYIIDKEGQSELLSQSNFKEYLRGLHLSISPVTDDLLFLFDLTQSFIVINYDYDDQVNDTTEKAEGSYRINFITGGVNNPISGNAVNTYINEAYPQAITDKLDTGTNASRIYLRGGAGTYARIKLFDPNNGEEILNQIKAKNWIINEANLVFYVDRDALDAGGGTEEPPRLYLYNADTNAPLYNPITDRSTANTSLGVFLNHDGILEKSNGKGIKYTIRITEYINDLVVRDSANATLGLAVTSDIRTRSQRTAMLADGEADVPLMSVVNPLGTVLYGSNVPSGEEKKLQLELFYTESNN